MSWILADWSLWSGSGIELSLNSPFYLMRWYSEICQFTPIVCWLNCWSGSDSSCSVILLHCRIIQRVYFLLMQPMSLTLWTAIWFIIICQIYPSFAPILIKLIDLLLYTLQVTCCFLKRAPPRGPHCLADVCSWYNTSDWMLAYWCHLHRCGMLWCLCVWFHFSITSWSVVAAYQVISTGQHNTIQHSMVQHQTIQHNTT